MPAEPAFRDDILETLVRKCIVFPADGSETRLDPMIARTVTVDDITSMRLFNRCVDMTSTFGDSYRKTRVASYQTTQEGVQYTYLLFYNLSLNLPINLNIARVIGVTPRQLQIEKRLFWRGDVVAMKVLPESEKLDFLVKSLDADLLESRSSELFFSDNYRRSVFESDLDSDEHTWNFYISYYCGPTSLLLGPPKSYWGSNAAEKEVHFLKDLNERRSAVGRPPLPPHVYMKSYTEHAVTLFSAFKSAFHKVTGPPKFPPALERRIFETCALENPEFCTVLVLVARRVHVWLDPILIATVCITQNFESKRRDQLERFLVKLTNDKPVKYYAQHIKNLAILGSFFEPEGTNRILAVCTGVENLVVLAPARGIDFFENPQAGRNLRRLTIRLENFSRGLQVASWSLPNFNHSCFSNLTHLHLSDDDEDWPAYVGWGNLTSLTHLAFSCAGPDETLPLVQTLPAIQYVALGHYCSGERYKYAKTVVNNSPHIRAAWGVRVVFLSEIPEHDWERGARGGGDFWDVVEQEVKRRLEEVSADGKSDAPTDWKSDAPADGKPDALPDGKSDAPTDGKSDAPTDGKSDAPVTGPRSKKAKKRRRRQSAIQGRA